MTKSELEQENTDLREALQEIHEDIGDLLNDDTEEEEADVEDEDDE